MSEDIGALFLAAPAAFMVVFAWLYLFVQTFAIPGSFLLNIVAGILFGEAAGLMLVACMAASGASCCYMLSSVAGASVTELAWLAPRLAHMRATVAQAKRKGTLFWYILSLRLFPVTPNYIVNIASPWVGVPLGSFWLTMAVGLSPYNYATVAAGATIKTLQDDFTPMNTSLFIKLCFIAVVALLPALCKARVQRLAGTAPAHTDEVPTAGAAAAVLPADASGGMLRRAVTSKVADPERATAAPDSAQQHGVLHGVLAWGATVLQQAKQALSRPKKEQTAD